MISLADLKKGQKAVIIKVQGDRKLYRRIMEMGMTPEAIVEIKAIAPLGDPVDILVKGYHLSLRKNEARGILVKITGE